MGEVRLPHAPGQPADRHDGYEARQEHKVDLLIEASHCLFLRLREYVTGTPHGDDAARILRIVFNRRADARDMDIDRTIEGLKAPVLDDIHQGLARQHPPAMAG